ncbi:hypothetical protein [Halovenus sp. HT40]|uniref:hypothetical protein n=1 Tax=Halovenus sp. HT40 TaxID=3126691 RepID=UPI00300E8D2D
MDEQTPPATLASERTALTVGSGAGLAGVFALLAVLGARTTNQPVLLASVAAAVVGAALGAVVGSRLLSIRSIRWLLASKRRTLLSWLPLAAALVVVLVLGMSELPAGSGEAFWPGLGAVLLMVVGWAAVIQAGQDSESTAAMNRTTVVLALPETSLFGSVLDDRWRRPLRAVLAGTLLATAAMIVSWENYVSVLFVLPAVLLFVPGLRMQPYVVDEGLIFENYLGSRIALGATFASWEELPTYRVEDGTLVIERDVGSPFRFDRADIEEFERVTEMLDRNLN